MSKELTPLQALEVIKNDPTNSFRFDEDYDYFNIIETALKKLEKPKEIVGTTTLDKALEQFLIDSCPEVKKKLKAFEIINEKNVDTLRIKITQNVTQYNKRKMWGCKNLVKKEYELLKEMLK